MSEWNVILRGGPRDGVLMRLPDITTRLIEGGACAVPVQGEYTRRDETEDGRIVFRWADSGTDSGSERLEQSPDRAQNE